jgi:hypothetical protein
VSDKKKYHEIGEEIGQLVQEKNEAYGDSFGQACRILEVLYPNGIQPAQYRDALAITRVIDKLFRLANKKDAFGESHGVTSADMQSLALLMTRILRRQNLSKVIGASGTC